MREIIKALIELLVVISIIALLVSTLMPALASPDTVCLSNQKTFSTAWLMYADANNGKLVGGTIWNDPVAVLHNKKSTLAFADGYAEMHAWIHRKMMRL